MRHVICLAYHSSARCRPTQSSTRRACRIVYSDQED